MGTEWVRVQFFCYRNISNSSACRFTSEWKGEKKVERETNRHSALHVIGHVDFVVVARSFIRRCCSPFPGGTWEEHTAAANTIVFHYCFVVASRSWIGWVNTSVNSLNHPHLPRPLASPTFFRCCGTRAFVWTKISEKFALVFDWLKVQ